MSSDGNRTCTGDCCPANEVHDLLRAVESTLQPITQSIERIARRRRAFGYSAVGALCLGGAAALCSLAFLIPLPFFVCYLLHERRKLQRQLAGELGQALALLDSKCPPGTREREALLELLAERSSGDIGHRLLLARVLSADWRPPEG